MYRLFFLVILLSTYARGYCQQHITILTDVSGSVPPKRAKDSREIIESVLLGNFKPGSYPDWKITEPAIAGSLQNILKGNAGSPIISNGSKILLYKVGEKESTKSSLVKTVIAQPNDLTTFLNQNYPTTFKQKWTYLQLARGISACEASKNSITSFLSIEATDDRNSESNQGDKVPKNPNYGLEEQELINNYDLQGRVEVQTLAVLSNNRYYIFIRQVQILQPNYCQIPITSTPIPKTQGTTKKAIPELKITSLSKSEENILDNENTTILWSCSGCTKNCKYQVQIKDDEGNIIESVETSSNSYTLPTEFSDGTYSISVKGIGMGQNAPFDSAGFQFSSGGSGAFFIIIGLLLLGLLYYFFIYRKKSNSKNDETKSDDWDNSSEDKTNSNEPNTPTDGGYF